MVLFFGDGNSNRSALPEPRVTSHEHAPSTADLTREPLERDCSEPCPNLRVFGISSDVKIRSTARQSQTAGPGGPKGFRESSLRHTSPSPGHRVDNQVIGSTNSLDELLTMPMAKKRLGPRGSSSVPDWPMACPASMRWPSEMERLEKLLYTER